MPQQLTLLGGNAIGRRHGSWLHPVFSSGGGKPAGATPDTVIVPPGTPGAASWLAGSPNSFYAQDVWGSFRSTGGYLAVPSGKRHVKIVFVGGGSWAGTWEAYGDNLAEGLFWGSIANTALDQAFEADLPATTTYLQLVMHPTSGSVFTQKVWAYFSPMVVGCNPSDWAIDTVTPNSGWSFVTTPYGTTQILVPGGHGGNVQSASWVPTLWNYGFTASASWNTSAPNIYIQRTEDSTHQFLAIRVNAFRPTGPVLICNN